MTDCGRKRWTLLLLFLFGLTLAGCNGIPSAITPRKLPADGSENFHVLDFST